MTSKSGSTADVFRTPATRGPDDVTHVPDAKSVQKSENSDDRSADSRSAENGSGIVLENQETVISKKSPSSSPMLPYPSSPLELGTTLEGTRLGHFQLEEFVGGGGMGAVFRAIDTMLGRTVAVKVLSRDRTDEDTRRRFKNEAQSAARLDHENIARVYYVGEDNGVNYIVFEFIEGVNIRDLVEHKGPLPLDEAVNYMLQIADALEHASLRDVVHRDIKPSNVLVTADGRAKLVDMGLARLHQMQSDSHDLTASGVTLGTFDYISPEQARDPRVADVRSDLYSLGCTFYFMLTGRPPFPEGTVLQKLLSHSSEAPSDPRMVRPDLHEDVVAIINRLLAKQPSQRYQRPSELVGALLMLANRLDLSNVKRTGAVWVSRPRTVLAMIERHLPWFAPAAILILAVMGVAWMWQPESVESFAKAPPILKAAPVVQPVEAGPPIVSPDEEVATEPSPEVNESTTVEVPVGGGSTNTGAVETKPETAPAAVAPAESTSPETQIEKPTTESPFKSAPTESNSDSANSNPQTPSADTTTSDGATTNSTATNIGDSASAASPTTPIHTDTSNSPNSPETPIDPVAGMPPVEEVFDELIVGPETLSAPAGTKVVSSLATACQLAASHDIDTIELHFNGPLEHDPFGIAVADLTIRAGHGFSPTIVFRPTAEDVAIDRRLIRISGGNVQWQGVHLLVEASDDTIDSWTVFRLVEVQSLTVSDSVFTLRNVDSSGRVIHDDLSFFETVNRTPIEPHATSSDSELRLPLHIEFARCIVRGQADILQSRKVSPFRLVAQQCLILTSEWLVDAGGANVKPNPKDGRIDVVLKEVTAVLGKGLCRLENDRQRPYQFDTVTDCRNCILFVTESNAPLIERRGVSSVADIEKRLYIRGRDNFYPGSMTLLRINPTGDPGEFLDFDFEERMHSWYQEESPRFMVMWKELPASDRTLDKQVPEDYALDESPNNPAFLGNGTMPTGVDPSQLPDIPSLDGDGAGAPAAAAAVESSEPAS